MKQTYPLKSIKNKYDINSLSDNRIKNIIYIYILIILIIIYNIDLQTDNNNYLILKLTPWL